ncbi:MAG: peroxiredoxin family protein [Myxococcota bacterium]
MNRLKSIFVSVFISVSVGICGYASWQLWGTRSWVWAAPLVTTLPFLLFLGRALALANFARTSDSLPLLSVVALGGVGIGVYGMLAGLGSGPLALAGVGAIGFLLYNFWYSKLDRSAPVRIVVGEPLPTLQLARGDGEPFDGAALKGPSLIFFFRGNWCPLCMAQIKEVAAQYQELDSLGVNVLLISPQPHGHTRSLAKRFDVSFEFLVDENNATARALGIAAEAGLPLGMEVLGYASETVLPTVIVVDADGVVRWLDQTDNYRVRPEPETFLPLLRELAAS